MSDYRPTKAQAEKVLDLVAEWLGHKGYGQWRNPPLPGTDKYDEVNFIAKAPTGKEAAYNGEGPELRMDFDWTGEDTVAIILEGGPYDWAIEVGDAIRDRMPKGIWTEPYSGWALLIFKG